VRVAFLPTSCPYGTSQAATSRTRPQLPTPLIQLPESFKLSGSLKLFRAFGKFGRKIAQIEKLLVPGLLLSLIHPLTNDNKCLQSDTAAFVKNLNIYDISLSRLPFTQNGDIRNTYLRLLAAIFAGQILIRS